MAEITFRQARKAMAKALQEPGLRAKYVRLIQNITVEWESVPCATLSDLANEIIDQLFYTKRT